MIGDLLELGSSHIMVDEEDSSNNAENFVKQVDLRINVSIIQKLYRLVIWFSVHVHVHLPL